MYTLYTDKSEDFKCNIGVEGADINSTVARLVVEGEDLNLLFEGKIDSDGDCVIPIKKLKNLLKEGTKGSLKLEVIAEDTFFSPWEDNFLVKTNKKVTVEVAGSEKEKINENSISVKVQLPEKDHSLVISKLLNKKGVNRANVAKNISLVENMVGKYVKKFNLKEPNKQFITEIINNLK